MHTSKVFLNAAELATRWGVSVGTLANWRSEEKGPSFVKIGTRVMYSLKVIEMFEENNTHHTNETLALAS